MGASISRHKPPNVSWEVLRAEICALNQDERCEVDIFPFSRRNSSQQQREDQLLQQQRFDRCSKKHEHDKFFVVKDLTLADLTTAGVPHSARCTETLDLIKQESVKTVKLVVTYTAKYRPDKFGAKSLRGLGGPCYFRTGTGYVSADRSLRAGTPSGFTPGTIFYINTACHVVYNDEEAEKTTVWFFFYDDENQSSVVKARGVKLVRADVEADSSQLICVVEDIHVAQEVGRRLKAASKFIQFPPNYNLSFCVSCPHGVALRVSFGNLNLVKRGDTCASEINRFKLFNRKLRHHCSMDEKKVLFFWFREALLKHPHVQTQTSPQSFPVRKDHANVALQYLMDKSLVAKPSEVEMLILQQAMTDMWAYVNSQVHQELRSRGLSDAEMTFIILHDIPQITAMSDRILRREAKHVVMRDGWKQSYQALKEEVGVKIGALQRGIGDHKLKLGSIRTMTYSIPTCPGSSGSWVSSFVFKDKLTIHRATHSMGAVGSTRTNRSGSGFVVTV